MTETVERRVTRLEEDAQAVQDSVAELLDHARLATRRMDRLDKRMDRLESRLDRIEDTLEGMHGKLYQIIALLRDNGGDS